MKNKGMGGHQSVNMKTDVWLTPPEILRPLGAFDLDPCSPLVRPWPTAATHFTIEDDGLLQPWFGRVWLNPPYGRTIDQWMKKMADHQNGIALIFARTDTRFFQQYVFPIASSLLYLAGRLNFYNTAGIRSKLNSGAPSVLIAYGEENSECLDKSGLKGHHHSLAPHLVVVGVSPTWFSIVSIAVRSYGTEELKPVYDMVERIAPDKISNNQHWKAKIRQVIQEIRRRSKPQISKLQLPFVS